MGLYIPYRGTLAEPGHDVANKRITTIVTAVTAETDLPDPTVSFDQLILRQKINQTPGDVSTHMLPRCNGPYKVLKVTLRASWGKFPGWGHK